MVFLRTLLVGLVVVATLTAQDGTTKKIPQDNGKNASLPGDPIQGIEMLNVKKLLDDLAVAGRVDRDGQALMRFQAQVDARLSELKQANVLFQANETNKKALLFVQQPKVATELARIAKIANEKAQEEAYQAFLTKNMVQEEFIHNGAAILGIQKELARGQKVKERLVALLKAHEAKGVRGDFLPRTIIIQDSLFSDVERALDNKKTEKAPASAPVSKDRGYLKAFADQ